MYLRRVLHHFSPSSFHQERSSIQDEGHQDGGVPHLSSWVVLTYLSHQPAIKNAKLTSLKWNAILFGAREAVERGGCIRNAFGHPPGNREGKGARSETRADCFYSLFRDLFWTPSHRCPAIIKKNPSCSIEAVGGKCCRRGSLWGRMKSNRGFLFVWNMFGFFSSLKYVTDLGGWHYIPPEAVR